MKTTILAAINCSLVFLGAHISGWVAEPTTQTRTLTFADRVAYQRAIEDVYWRHRIWPKERPDPKPSLDAVMSQAQIEKKVEEYLRNSQALEDHWQRPITAGQLQTDMERMASQTKQPEVLHEIFEALGNDPFVIAECLARPVLAERLLTSWYAYDETIHGELKQRAAAELQAHNSVEQMKQLGGTYSEIEFIKSDSGDMSQQRDARSVKLNSRQWDETLQKIAATFRRAGSYQTNGRNGPPGRLPLPARSAYATVDYETIPLNELCALQEDERRYYATTVIERTSDQLKVATVSWLKEPLDSWLARGENEVPNIMTVSTGNYQLPAISGGAGGCIDDSWTATPGDRPRRRAGHSAVWTGSEMIVWGGYNSGPLLNTGERYNPSTDSWTATSIVNAPTARSAPAVWTGSEMIVWGGHDGSSYVNTGGRYNPGTDNWTATSTTNAPAARGGHTAVWTGSEMIVWSGYGGTELDTGGRYNPLTDSWIATTTTNAPEARNAHTAVWSGSEMIVWGGSFCDGNGNCYFINTGGRYNPLTDSWIATTITNAPEAREAHTAVWTGSEMIVWGGVYRTANCQVLNAGGRYNPGTDSWTATSTINAPAGRTTHTAVWTGSEMIVWGGFDNPNQVTVNTGGRYNPATDSWTATSTTNAPEARYAHTAVWSGSEMIVWGGLHYGGNFHYLNTGGRYNPLTDSWTATSTTAYAPDGRYFHTAVWTGSEMIVWGGQDGLADLNTGGKYDPITDSWTATSTTNAPTGREAPAVWTGSEMIVWGGVYCTANCQVLNTGGRYNPITDSWTATSTTNAPEARSSHTAVWTDSEMIVWGGVGDNGVLDTGGRYNPTTDSWTATSTTNAPSARYFHTAVWTGSEMIVWGGGYWTANCQYLNTGGRYNPITDSWTATSTTDAPEARYGHTAVWTGSEMLIWGGWNVVNYFNTGGRYNPGSDSWTATSTTNAPEARNAHTAVWSGSEMIVWGGGAFLDTGGRYCAAGAGPTPTPTPTATPRPRPITVTFNTNPAGLSYRVDGTTYNSAHVFSWRSGSSHTISATSPQNGGSGVRYVWQRWSDNGAMSHTIAPTTSTAYTATLTTKYYLSMNARTGGSVTPASGWRNKGAQVTIRATPANGYHFTGWRGSGNGSYSGLNNPASITMNGPIAETASFSQ